MTSKKLIQDQVDNLQVASEQLREPSKTVMKNKILSLGNSLKKPNFMELPEELAEIETSDLALLKAHIDVALDKENSYANRKNSIDQAYIILKGILGVTI
ncbi:MAG: hypothetical protein WD059_01445 [Balneolaceae bacterium]